MSVTQPKPKAVLEVGESVTPFRKGVRDVPPPPGSGGVTLGKFIKLYIAADNFWCIFMHQKVVL